MKVNYEGEEISVVNYFSILNQESMKKINNVRIA